MLTLLQKTFILAISAVLFGTTLETDVVCPNTFPGGVWENCNNRENETCTYSCLSGFHKDPKIKNATCLPDGAWNRNTEKLCRRKCDMGIENGYIYSICTLDIGVSCSFVCNLGFKAVSNISTVTCDENGEWEPEKPCEDVLCPTTIQNGRVNEAACDRHIYSECPVICNQGYDPNPVHNKVICEIDGTWGEVDEPSCLERKGLCVNVFEHGKWTDDCHFNADETCAFECEGGFDKNPSITTNITCTSSSQWNIDLSLLCKENGRGLIVTELDGFNTKHLYTVPTTLDGTPNLNYIRSLRLPTTAQFLSVDGDYTLKHAYVYDHATSAIYKDANFSIGLSGDNNWTTFHMGTSRDYVKLAVDWISHNIYWTDPQYKWIMVQSLLGNDTSLYRVLIHENLEGPHGLALDPIECLLFWSDIGTFTKIEVASLSGRNRKSLISSNLLHPYSLTTDYVDRRLYFIDSGRRTVETVTYEGRDRKVLLKNLYSYFFDIALYKDYLYVTDPDSEMLYFFNKTNGKELHNSLYREDAGYVGITVFNPDAQPTSATAHCLNYGCKHICVTEKDGATCLCKDGYTLSQDMKTCSLSNEYFHRGLMYSNESSICIVDIRIVTAFIFTPNCVLKTNGTKYMVMDTDKRQIIFANYTAIYAASVDNPSLHRLTKQSGIISGMAWDGYDRNLYWTEENTGIIWRLSEESQTAQIFIDGLSRPRDVIVLPHERLIYWISDRNGTTIESSKTDGSNHQMVLNSADIVDPRSLSYDPYAKRIYFLDSSQSDHNSVYSCKLDGSDLSFFLLSYKILEKLEIYRGHLLVTEANANGTLLSSFSIDLRTTSTSGVFSGAGNISSIKVFDETFRQNETGPCFTLNGDCEQICIANGKSRICECTFGFKLSGNGKTCMSDPVEDNFILIIDSTHNGIYQISLTNQSIQGIISQTMSYMTGVTYNPVHDLVIWGSDESELSIMHLNGTGKKLLPVGSNSESNFVFPNRLAVDYSTGNIYFTAVDYMDFFNLSGSINVISPDGKHRVLVTGLESPHGLVVYPSKGLMFYTESGIKAYLGQASMDGSQSKVLLDLDNHWPTDLVIDYRSDYLYWIDYSDDSIKTCKLDRTEYRTLAKYHDISLIGLALYQDYLFISTAEHSHMMKLKISNPNDTTAFDALGELGTIGGISIYSSTIQNRNAFCSSGNGGCSTFCFPTPGGSVCSCEDGVDLKKGSDKECSNKLTVTCPNKFPGGSWDNCQNRENETCTYSCFLGFHKNQKIQNATCGLDGAWNRNTEKLCRQTDVVCPNTFPGGVWENCNNRENETCTYSCLSGFHKDPKIKNATCLPDGAWNRNTEKLCRRKCDMGIENGYIYSICTLDIGVSCSFVCNLGFKAVSNISTVTCDENGEWEPEKPCEDVLCPTTIQNGRVNEAACDRHIYSECPVICNQGYDPNPVHNKVICEIDGTWGEVDEPSCLERKGLCVNVFEHGKWTDDCHFNADVTCAFECEGGFDKNPSITTNITCTSSSQWNIDLSLLCKENGRGLIVTELDGFNTKHLYTVPTTLDGTPNLNYIRSLRLPTTAQFLSVDGDYTLKHAYVYDHDTSAIYKDANFSIGLSGDNNWTTFHMGTSRDYVKLAVDWISHNIYWTDPQYKWIMVQSLLGNDTSLYRVLIHENLEGPHGLALDPIECLLFWSDIGTFTKIEVASLSGRNRKSLISSNLFRPYSLTTDYVDRRLYFIDSGRATVETVTYEGRDRKVLLKNLYSYFFDIALYKDYLYVTDPHSEMLYFFNKTNGKELHNSLYREDAGYVGITVFNPDAQPTSATAHCLNYGCKQICVTEKDGATCLCKDGYTLRQDMKTCSLSNEYFHRGLMYSNESSICIVDIRIVTAFIFTPNCVLKTNGTKYMVMDTDKRQIIFANYTAIYAASVDNPSLHRLTKQSGVISGMAWDGYDRNLYWTEENTGIIWRLSEESQTAQIFIDGLSRPRDVIVLPHERLIYWISDRNGTTIESSKTDGSNHQMVLNSADIVDPRSLSYDPFAKRIYFLDSSQSDHNSVYSCKLDGSDLSFFLLSYKILEKLEIYRGHLLVTEANANGTLLSSFSIDLRTTSTSGVFSGAGNISSIKVFDETFRQNETGPCFTLNGDCEQICIANGKSRICECTFGFKLSGNGKTCMSDPVEDNFILIIDSTHNGIYQISLTNQSIQGIISQTMSYMTGVTYNPVHDLVIWGSDESELSIMHLNGTGKKLLPVGSNSESNFVFPNRLAVDYSTGNIYFTAVDYMDFFNLSGSINVISPDGKHRVLVTGLESPHGLVVYPSKGLMFYTESGIKAYLGQASMDGSQSKVLLDLDNHWPTDLVIDYRSDYLYWIDYSDDSIKTCKLDGTEYRTLAKYHDISLIGLALYQDYLFISTAEHSHMMKLKISNPNDTTAFDALGELGTIGGISIYSSTIQNRNAFCSSGNGGCSTFCFPTPGGSVCSCEDGVDLKKGSDKECSNKLTVTCPNKFPGGSWDNCQNRENETCTYSCFLGFHKNQKIQNATCGLDGAWNRNTEKLCRRKCGMGITNGYLNSNCTLDIGESCSFECVLGFKSVSNISTVTCHENGEWEPEEPCIDVLCPTTIQNGRVNEAACDRHIYSECPVICNQGYDPNPRHNKVICEVGGTWSEVDKPSCLERKGLCVNVFEHGKWTDNCHFNADETCAFECEGGFDKNPSITRNITCTSSSQWNIDLSLLCKENGRGLIVTEFSEFNTKHLYTVPTTLDGTPNLNYIRSLRLPKTAQFFSVDGDYTLKHAYVYDHATNAIYKDANFSIGLSGDTDWTTVHMGTAKGYVKLAVDWISHNIYWTDPQYRWIMVQTLLGNDTSLYRVLIHENLEGPNGLALDPIESLLFWSDIGTFTKIEVASLSGRNRKSLISSNLFRPYSLAADYENRRLYFIDSGRRTVETVTYEGRDRKVLLKKIYSYFFDIALYKDYLYVTDPISERLYFFNKTNGKELHNSLYREDASYLGITVFNPDAQPTSATAHCLNYGCEQICVTDKDGATCLCKDGYTLSQDMKTCSLSNEYFHRGLMYSNESSICIVDIRIITAITFTPNCVLKTNGTKYIVIDTDKRQIIFANNTAIYAASVDSLSLHRLTKQSGIISGMAWDGYDRNLYWTEENTGIIWRLSEGSQTAKIFIEGLIRPRDVLVLPHERLIYWISDRNGTTIESSKMDGSNHQVVLNSADIVDPRSLSYDPYAKRIYFVNSSHADLTYVYSCKLDGSDLSIFLSTNRILEKLEIYRGHLLVTGKYANRTLLISYSIDHGTTSTSGIFSGAGNISSIKVFDETFRQNETGPCFTLNGDCEQICIANAKSRICECTFGFKLSGNGKTCMSDPVKDNFILIVDSTHNGIYQISLTNQNIQGISTQTMSYLNGVTYNPVHDLVIWGSDESELTIMHLNGTGKKLLPVASNSEGYFGFTKPLAVDYSTGNIYFTTFDYMAYFNSSGSINVISPDGKHRVLITGLESPNGLVVYPSKGLMFYIENGVNPYLGQSGMDGSQSKVLLDLDDHWPTDLVIDYRSDYLYWINYRDDSIKSCKLDGTEYRTLAKYLDISLNGLALYQDYLFISTAEHSHMMKLKISNPNKTTAFDVLGELGTIEGISIYSSTVQNRNAFCASGNGGCSTFCFPTPGGRVCGCEDGVDLKKGSDKECSNMGICNATIPNGSLPINCNLNIGSTCFYYCDDHFHKNPNISSIQCNENGEWNADLNLLCTKSTVTCPNKFPGGSWDNCQNMENEICTYSCFPGFHKSPKIQNATCGLDGAWNQNTEKLCRRKCDPKITNGFLDSSCKLEIGDVCSFECWHGYKVAPGVSTVTCQENGLWAPEEPCEAVLCPTTIPNGTVNDTVCDRRIYSECPFTCNQGFDPHPKNNKVFCNMRGKWNDLEIPYCIERKGKCVNFFKHGKWANDCHFNANETCAFECDGGFDKNPNITRNITCTSSAEWNIDLRLLCKENNRGLIVTLFPLFEESHAYTIPTHPDGTPSPNFNRSLRYPIDVQLYSVDGDYTLQQAYVYDHYTKAIYKDSNFSIGLSGENKLTTLHRGISEDYVKLAVDWISHNIYWTDPQYKWIMVQSLLGDDTLMYRVLIHDDLNGPHALALDPLEALLFWSDIGTFTKIEVSSLSGRNRKSLVYSNLLSPYGMAADHASRHLYFVDAGRETVETVTYDGKDRKVLLNKKHSYFFDIAVFKDYLYVTTKYDNLYFLNKTNGKELHKSLSPEGIMPLAVTVFHPNAQTASVTAHCVNYGCEQICVTEIDGATCLCKDGYNLNQDQKTCSLNNEFFHRGLMYSNESSICIVDIRVVTQFVFYPNCVLKTNGTKYMALDTDDRKILFANETAIYWVRVDGPEFHRLTEPSGTISGLAWDGYDRNLYWTEHNTGIIWRLSWESRTTQVFLKGLNNPRDILILPHERLVYWISDRNGSTIESCGMDGSNLQVVLNSDDLVDPKSLSYDPQNKRIYFLSTSPKGRNYVRSCDLDGADLVYFLSPDKSLEKLEIYKGHLLVTAKDAHETLIMSYSVDNQKLTTSGIFNGTGYISAIKVFDENFRQNGTGTCFHLNGDCEQVCISNGKSRICGCTFGFKLAGSGKTCTSEPIKDNFMLARDSTHNTIYQISLTDQSVQGINAQGTDFTKGLTYNPVNSLVIWGTDESELSIMHLNGTGKKLLPISLSDGSYVSFYRFAVDYSTGNIYYTAVTNLYRVTHEGYIGVISPDRKHRVLVKGLEYPHGLVVYPSKGLLFYTDSGFRAHLGQANMDGSQSAVLLNMHDDWPSDLTVDYKRDYLYWISSWKDSIEYCRLDGTNHDTLTKYPGTSLNGIAFYQDYLFISTVARSHIIKLNISNPNDTTAFASHAELGTIHFIGIYSSTDQNKNKLCSADNGGCSTFCFPVSGGRICGCEDGVDIKEGSQTVCSNIPYCPEIRKNIIASTDCPRLNGTKCKFTCMQGYKAKPGVDKVFCNGEIYIPEDTCEEIRCPGTLANGNWANCNFSMGTSCNYTCNYGYTRNDAVTEAKCQINGNWNLASTDTLCKPITCPKQFIQGIIVSTCSGMLGQRCEYECTGYGYKKNENISIIECMESGTWSEETNSLCQQLTCPKEIPNGALLRDSNGHVCSTAVGTRCGYECDTGFVKARNVDSLHCLLDGWAEDLQTLCIAITCPKQFNQGRIASTCAGMHGQQCDYECTGYGYKKNENIATIECMDSGTWSRDTDSLCQQITCPKEIPNGALVKGSDGLVCSTAVGTRCDFECNSGYFKDPSVQSLYCLLDGWAQDLHTLCTVPPAVSSGHHSDVHPAAIGAGVAIGVSIIIVIILVILRRKRLFSKFVLKRKDDELISGPDMQMSTSFGPEEDRQYDHVEYDSYLVNTSGPTKQEPTEVSLPTKYNIMGNSTKYDSDMAIPRPRAKENPLNKTP